MRRFLRTPCARRPRRSVTGQSTESTSSHPFTLPRNKIPSRNATRRCPEKNHRAIPRPTPRTTTRPRRMNHLTRRRRRDLVTPWLHPTTPMWARLCFGRGTCATPHRRRVDVHLSVVFRPQGVARGRDGDENGHAHGRAQGVRQHPHAPVSRRETGAFGGGVRRRGAHLPPRSLPRIQAEPPA